MHHIFTIIDDAHHQHYYLLLTVSWMLGSKGVVDCATFTRNGLAKVGSMGKVNLCAFCQPRAQVHFCCRLQQKKSFVWWEKESFTKSQSPWRRKWLHTESDRPREGCLGHSQPPPVECEVRACALGMINYRSISVFTFRKCDARVYRASVYLTDCFDEQWCLKSGAKLPLWCLGQEDSGASPAGDWTFPRERVKCDQVDAKFTMLSHAGVTLREAFCGSCTRIGFSSMKWMAYETNINYSRVF